MQLENHPTVARWRAGALNPPSTATQPLDLAALRAAILEAGADDVGFVALERPELAPQRAEILALWPSARSLVSFVVRMNPEAIRSTARSVANLEFHQAGEEVNEVSRRIVHLLAGHGFRGVAPAMGFPMEMDRFPGKTFVVSHKPIAEAAGLGVMGIHRNVIHPRFGNFILLGTVLTDAPLEAAQGARLDYSPCLECKLCVAVCPTGAIKPDGGFDFVACYAHNYREFMGGFTDLLETVADAKDRFALRKKLTDSESASWWQSLGFGPNYKAAYCLAACPAGEDVISPFLANRKAFVEEIVRPLQDKEEIVYVLPETDAEEHVARRFPKKRSRRVGSVLRPVSIPSFLRGAPLTFQRGRSTGLAAAYHFCFTGREAQEATFTIRDQKLSVRPGLVGEAHVRITVDGEFWVAYLRGERGLLPALATGKLRVRGPLRLFRAFARCFPGRA